MQAYRCKICGETHLAVGRPGNCPFCGAHEPNMIIADHWVDKDQGIKLTDVSKKNLEIALEVEISNTAFYQAAADLSIFPENKSIFKRLSRVESEHASVIAKILGIEKPDIPKGKASENDLDNYKEALEREKKAVAHYQQARDKAIEKRVRQVFVALVEVENDHLKFDKANVGKMALKSI
ncbi:MAG: ferritin [Actinobacteria bacterium]|nr:MAG: ferritin [Actinomycetota bacterium]